MKINKLIFILIGLLVFSFSPSEVFASTAALSGSRGGGGMPYEQALSAIWTSISTFVAPLAVGLGVIGGGLAFLKGNPGAAMYTLFGCAICGGLALMVNDVFQRFGWSGCLF